MANEYDVTRKFLNNVRDFKMNRSYIHEAIQAQVIIPQTDENFVETKNNINSSVGSVKFDDKSLIVYPQDNDVVLNGVITDLNNLKFQFKYNDQNGGLYLWVDALLLTKDNANKLTKLVAIKDQWKEYWSNNLENYQKEE